MKTWLYKVVEADILIKIAYIVVSILLLLNIEFYDGTVYSEKILQLINHPIYSNGNSGLYFPGIYYLIALLMVCIYLNINYKDKNNKKSWNLILFQIVLAMVVKSVMVIFN